MPSEWHDTVNELIDERPELVVEILRDLMGVGLPPGIPARTATQVFNTRPSRDLIADNVAASGVQDPGGDSGNNSLARLQPDCQGALR